MATTSEVKAGLDDIAKAIRAERQAMKSAKARMVAGRGNLDQIPTVFSDVLATINAYGTTNAFEALAKAEFAKLATEFVALRGAADVAVTGLGDITEF
jgi:hypothetical protein